MKSVIKTATAEEKDKIESGPGTGSRTVVTHDGWKLVLTQTGEHMLFDLNQYPPETENLYHINNEKACELTAKIKKWQKETNDTMCDLPL